MHTAILTTIMCFNVSLSVLTYPKLVVKCNNGNLFICQTIHLKQNHKID